ncbi:MAG TPA: low affinity iron permease family protein [Rhodopila sp.]|nr:low affinity iron permease family protein [Rhodopila sp.]
MADDKKTHLTLSDRFSRAAQWTSQQCGRAHTFIAAVVLIVVWALCGPTFHYSDTWQLVVNTGTTIITFLMVFLIQNTQNRDATAIHLKLDELIKATENAHNRMVSLEDLTESQLRELKESLAGSVPAGTSREPTETTQQKPQKVSSGTDEVKNIILDERHPTETERETGKRT